MDFAALDAFQRDPYPHYSRARREPGLTFVPELDAWLVARYADVREALARPDDLSSAGALRPDAVPGPEARAALAEGAGAGGVVLSSDGPAHRRYRAPHTRGLSAARVDAAQDFIRRRAADLVDGLAADGGADLVERLARVLPGEVIGHLTGLDPGDVPAVVRGGYLATDLALRPLDSGDQVAAAEEIARLQRRMDGYVRSRRAEPRDDLITVFVQALAPEAGELTREQSGECVSSLQNMLLAGHLTTSALMASTLLHLLRRREQWEALCEDPGLIPDAVEECARFDSPIQGFRRRAVRETALGGTTLPEGAVLFVSFGAANRDPARFPQPDRLDITRRPQRHLGFGHGVHACPGARLARAQLTAVLHELTRRLPGARLDPDARISMLPTMIHRSPDRLDVRW
ncbi:cytochrome P450 [Streptomonospora wellingtoniae]|uniref:Cytochrome P450 n=1 Tax=Streptomonospora wellingtoniae TaxID=3075544 RepID=A0ABU2KTI8_9ACTN|nr:cytochrome P450 [Streptomonospora sp. DSM 45055]MDT0302601.1 cytochrome P450 [Streptomonospora sp. DSM 45055]